MLTNFREVEQLKKACPNASYLILVAGYLYSIARIHILKAIVAAWMFSHLTKVGTGYHYVSKDAIVLFSSRK
jgi:hypothetical protein